jgi:UDP-N-acetylglucosamine 1-carboxyvinyltransferase
VADGVTRVTELKHLDRGYVNFHEKLADLGADIERIQEQEETFTVVETLISDMNA